MWEMVRKWSVLLLTLSVVLSLALEIKTPNYNSSPPSSNSWKFNHPLFIFSKDIFTTTTKFSDSSSSSSIDPSSSSSIDPSSSSSVLEYDFYRNSCPQAETIVRSMIQDFYKFRSNVAPALLRLLFHDCFIEGCDASVLLDAINGIESEKEAPPNQSLKGFDMIDMIKSEIELACPATVSCSDILVLATRDAVGLAGGPFYPLLTGRRDSSLSFPEVASFELPAPQDDLTKTLLSFSSRGFDERETVSLLGGGHSIGVIHCRFFRNRLYNYAGSGTADPSLEPGFLHLMRTTCSNIESSGSLIQDPTLEEPGVVMDYGGTSKTSFGTHYYQSLVQGRGILHADQQLMTYEGTANWVRAYASHATLFRRDFSMVMMKLSGLRVLTGSLGLIRVNCSSINPPGYY